MKLKIRVRIALCAVLLALAAVMAYLTVAEFQRANAQRAAGYVLGAADGSVAVYAGGDLKTPLRVTEIEMASLREADRALIAAGLSVGTREEVLQMLEDLGT